MTEENKTYERQRKITDAFLGEILYLLNLAVKRKLCMHLRNYCDAWNISIDIEKTVDDFLTKRGEK